MFRGNLESDFPGARETRCRQNVVIVSLHGTEEVGRLEVSGQQGGEVFTKLERPPKAPDKDGTLSDLRLAGPDHPATVQAPACSHVHCAFRPLHAPYLRDPLPPPRFTTLTDANERPVDHCPISLERMEDPVLVCDGAPSETAPLLHDFGGFFCDNSSYRWKPRQKTGWSQGRLEVRKLGLLQQRLPLLQL